MKRAARGGVKVDVLVESGLWKEPAKARSVLRQAIRRAAATLSTRQAELAIVLTDDSAIRLLNRQWRGIDAATNVLSFPIKGAGGDPRLVGDIVLAYETIAREARADHKPFAHHLAHLAVHGFLHLFGYDHQRALQAEAMEQAERDILLQLDIPDPYRAPAKRSNNKRTNRPARARRSLTHSLMRN
jgi:probable rRNA maturation factor